MSQPIQFYLASKSPRRAQILADLKLNYALIDSEIDETLYEDELAEIYVKRMAKQKALAALRHRPDSTLPVLAADTIVVLGNKIFTKPNHKEEAMDFLKQLSGKVHQVMTSVCMTQSFESLLIKTSISSVKFTQLNKEIISAYCNTQEPYDKAGAYAVQGLAGIFIEKIQGSYSGIMGLPVFETAELLTAFDIGLLNDQ